MKRAFAFFIAAVIAGSACAQFPSLEGILPGLGTSSKPATTPPSAGAPDDRTSASGIKEALAVGTENAVKNLSRTDGYFGNQAVKILMPPSIQKLGSMARAAGFQKQVDEFVLSMNRAAEAAAPVAAQYFGDAIREMTLEDARAILTGGNTAATDFFRSKTRDKLYVAFKPTVSQKVGEVGTTRAYQDLVGQFQNVPMLGKQSLDLDDYVTNKALDGLFYMVAEEEKKIRTNPAARTTDLLKAVFGR
jgi:Protein of unknown function (DUF4197)